MELELAALDPAQLVVGQPEVGEPVEEVGLEDLGRAVEAVTREPDHLLLGEAERSRMVELGPQLALVDLLGELHRRGAVDQREGRVDLGVEAPDHLQHQELVEIGVEQAPDDRIELPGVVVDPPGDVGFRHSRFPPSRCGVLGPPRGKIYSFGFGACGSARRGFRPRLVAVWAASCGDPGEAIASCG